MSGQVSSEGGFRWRQTVLAGLALTAVVLVALPPVVWFFQSRHGQEGLTAAVVAAALCWVGGLLALGTHAFFRDPKLAVAGALAGTLVRMVFVFGWVLVLSSASPALIRGGFLMAAVVFFTITLAAETGLVLWTLKKSPASGASGADPSKPVG